MPMLAHALEEVGTLERVLIEEPVPAGTIIRRRAKRLGWWTVFGQVVFQGLAVPILKQGAKKRVAEIVEQAALDGRPVSPELIQRVSSVNSEDTIRVLRESHPDLVVVHGTRILSANVLSSTPALFLNIHAGITPRYRGGHGAYWALVEERPDACGVTIHQVDTGIDTGTIFGQILIHPTPADSFVTYPWLQLAAGIACLRELLRRPRKAWKPVIPPPGESRLWFHPTIWGYLWARWSRGIK